MCLCFAINLMVVLFHDQYIKVQCFLMNGCVLVYKRKRAEFICSMPFHEFYIDFLLWNYDKHLSFENVFKSVYVFWAHINVWIVSIRDIQLNKQGLNCRDWTSFCHWIDHAHWQICESCSWFWLLTALLKSSICKIP